MTDRFDDAHDSTVLLKGGSQYMTTTTNGGNNWYYQRGSTLQFHNKMFLMGASYERAGTVSFRCVADA